MRGRLTTVISDVKDMDLLEVNGAEALPLRPLLARIARRPGRWRRRMQGRRDWQEELSGSTDSPLPEAA